MRARLVINPVATGVSAALEQHVIARLSQVVELSVSHTSGRGEATSLAVDAAADGVDVVIALGGDGTVHEIAQGLMSIDRDCRPMLAALPAGNASVFARAMGFSNRTRIAVDELCSALTANHSTSIGVGSVSWTSTDSDDLRWFLFNAGLGLDARVIAAMEELRAHGRRVNDATYVWLAARELARGNAAHMSVHGIDGELDWTIVTNLSPWTFAGPIALDPHRGSGSQNGLNVFGVRSMSLARVPRVLRALRGGSKDSNQLVHLENQSGVSVSATDPSSPIWLQVDGESLGQALRVEFRHEADQIRVVCPVGTK